MSKRKRDYYDVLGVSRTATADEIRKAYRRLARKLHPDVNDSPDAAEQFAEVGEAYAVLNDAERRSTYDRFGHAGVGASGGGAGAAGASAGWSGFGGGGGVDLGDIGSIFEEMMGRGRGPAPFGGQGPRRPGPPPPARGGDLDHRVTVSFLTAARGGTERLRLNRGGVTQTLDLRIPAGIDDGAKLRVKGKGQPGAAGGAAGDLIVVVQVGGHPHFRREGLDLSIDVPVTIAEAAFGVTVRVPLLDGHVDVKIPPSTSGGRKLRLKGKGITDAKGRVGDFYVVVEVVAPDPMSERVRDLLETLAVELKSPRDSAPWVDEAPGSPGAA